jgi:hypothetical protein
MQIYSEAVASLASRIDPVMLVRVDTLVDRIVAAKERGGKVAVVTGSGPNIHEGVTTLIAELIRAGVVDAVTTSSAVVAHEMGGTLDEVKRCPGAGLDVDSAWLPKGDEFELSVMSDDSLRALEQDIRLDWALIERLKQSDGKTIIKAAGNLGYPMGLWVEHISVCIRDRARDEGVPFEVVAGRFADPCTMIGAGARTDKPVLVTIPQLIGGGAVGLNIGDSISITERAERLARMMDSADVVIESGVALTQEIHDGPFELHTGHGLWAAWQGQFAYSLEGKTLARIDLDPALEKVYQAEQGDAAVQQAIADGKPKTKLFDVPFRMEMSGFARHAGAVPIIADIGVVWPIVASRVAERLGLTLEFMSYPQDTEQGQAARRWIVDEVSPTERPD